MNLMRHQPSLPSWMTRSCISMATMLFFLTTVAVGQQPTTSQPTKVSKEAARVSPRPDRKIVYKTTPQGELMLHLFLPKDWKPTDHRGAIVFFFGGGWTGGSPSQFYHQSRQLADRGMVAISAEYRVNSRHKTSPFECVEDGKSAVRYVREHANQLGVDPNRVAAGGGSAGGHVAVCTAVIGKFDAESENGPDRASSIPKVVVAFNPVLDCSNLGYGHNKLKDRYREISPVEHVQSGQSPMLIFHGTADTTVPFENAKRFGDLMKEAGNDCEIVPFEGMKHGFFNYGRNGNKPYTKSMKQTEQFLQQHGFFGDNN